MCIFHVPILLCEVATERRIPSGGRLDHYRWVCVCGGGGVNWVNHVSGPLGVRSRQPNGLIREEGVDDGMGSSGKSAPTFSPTSGAYLKITWCLPGAPPGRLGFEIVDDFVSPRRGLWVISTEQTHRSTLAASPTTIHGFLPRLPPPSCIGIWTRECCKGRPLLAGCRTGN